MLLHKALRFGRGEEKVPVPRNGAPEGKLPLKVVRRTVEDLTPQEREFLPHLLEIEETPPSPVQRYVLWTILALVAVAIIWSYFGQITVVSSAQGKFIPDGRVKQIQPVETSVVKAIHVREGQHVKEGELLIELDPALSEADLSSANLNYQQNRLEQARLIAELKGSNPGYAKDASPEAIALQEALRQAQLATYQTKLNAARATIDERQSALAVAEAQLKKAESTLEIAQEREQKMATLAQSGFISRMEYLKNLQELETATHDLDAQRKTVDQQRHSHRQAMEQYNTIQQEWRSGILGDLNREVVAHPGLKRDMDKAERLNDLKTMRSPVTGYVQAVGVTTLGGVVTPAQNLITIVPDGTPLIVEASLSNEDIGYVRPGQDVEIKVDTFPFQKYGTLKGKLVWISPDAEEKTQGSDSGNGNSTTGKSSPDPKTAKTSFVYKIHIQPEKTAFQVDGKPTPIQPGMTVQADITTDHRRVIEFFLSPVIKYLDEGLKVR